MGALRRGRHGPDGAGGRRPGARAGGRHHAGRPARGRRHPAAEAGERATAAPEDVRPLAGATLRAPLQPPSMRDFRASCSTCATAGPASAPPPSSTRSGCRSRPSTSPTPPPSSARTTTCRSRPGCERFDFELEVAAVIGTRRLDHPADQAEDHIAGYHDLLRLERARPADRARWRCSSGPAKGKDGANTLGPMLVTARRDRPYAQRQGLRPGDDRVRQRRAGRRRALDAASTGASPTSSPTPRAAPACARATCIGSGTVPPGACSSTSHATRATSAAGCSPATRCGCAVEQLGETARPDRRGRRGHPLRTGF